MMASLSENISEFTLDELDTTLISFRKDAVGRWPYSGTNAEIRTIEAEYERRGIALPENRDR